MDLANSADQRAEQFIERWHGAAGSELATAQSLVIALCELLEVERPHATADQDYMFERPLKERHSDGSESDRRLDCYKRGHFILEAKKVNTSSHAKNYNNTLMGAHAQAQNYARALPAAEGRPPIILVVDVGQVLGRGTAVATQQDQNHPTQGGVGHCHQTPAWSTRFELPVRERCYRVKAQQSPTPAPHPKAQSPAPCLTAASCLTQGLRHKRS